MKILLKSGEELQINSSMMLSENQLQISFKGILEYDQLRTKLTGDALSRISVYETDSSVNCSIYDGFTTIIYPSSVTVEADGTMNVVFAFQKEDQTTKMLRELQTKIEALSAI